jgi:hypothetical protein
MLMRWVLISKYYVTGPVQLHSLQLSSRSLIIIMAKIYVKLTWKLFKFSLTTIDLFSLTVSV